jgi:hypothetical protein
MPANATLRDEAIFERHLWGLVGGGLAAGVVTGLLGLVVGQQIPAMGALSFAAVVGLAVNQLDPRADTALLRLILALMGGVLMGGIAQLGFAGSALLGAGVGGGFIGAALTFDRSESRQRFALGILLFAAALPAGVFSADILFPQSFLQFLDPLFAREAVVGATWGLFLAVAAGASDLRLEQDEQLGLLDEALSRHQEPVRDYLESARELHHQVLRECERAESDDTRRRAREIAGETIDSLLRFAARFQELRAALQATGSDRLARRIERLDRRIEQAGTPSIAREIEQARDEARQQVQMRERLELACVRLESRLQRSVTTLEKLHLTLVQHATSTANDAGLTESLARLEQLAEEVQFQNLSVDELCELNGLNELVDDIDDDAEFEGKEGEEGKADEAKAATEPAEELEKAPASAHAPR